MSIRLMSQVMESDLPSSEKFILVVCADHGRDNGSGIYPGIETIARKTSLSKRTVRRLIQNLIARGILTVVKKSARGRRTEYFLRGDMLTPQNKILKGTPRDSWGDTMTPQNNTLEGTSTTLLGGHGDTLGGTSTTLQGPSLIIEPSLNRPRNTHVCDSGERFKTFWTLYPARDGQKFNQEKARALFFQFNAEEQDLLIQAARNYANCEAVLRGIGIRDACNFFKDDFWRQFVEGAGALAGSPRRHRDEEWKRQLEKDNAEQKEFERKIASGEIRVAPRPRFPFESVADYERKKEAGLLPRVVVNDLQEGP